MGSSHLPDSHGARRHTWAVRLVSELSQLAKRFPQSLIQQLPGKGWSADYVSWSNVVEKLLATLEHPPSWRTLEQWEAGNKVFVLVRLEAIVDGHPVTAEATGEGDGTDYLTAESRARCRAAALIGCALHLWSGDTYRLDKALGSRCLTGTPKMSSGSPMSATTGKTLFELAMNKLEDTSTRARPHRQRTGPAPQRHKTMTVYLAQHATRKDRYDLDSDLEIITTLRLIAALLVVIIVLIALGFVVLFAWG